MARKRKAEERGQEAIKSEGDFPEVLTIDQAAAFLQLSRATLYRLIEQGDISVKRVGKRYRFSRKALLEWIEKGD